MKKVVCSTCGSDLVEGTFWVNLNTMQVGDSADTGDTWCSQCQEVTDIETEEEYNKQKEEDNE